MKTLSILFVLFFNHFGIVIGNGDQSAGPGQPTKFRVMSFSSLWLMELEENYKSGFPKQFSKCWKPREPDFFVTTFMAKLKTTATQEVIAAESALS
ncbi:unnamed protein product [Allacma fusca]|uniref:Secreted protein n=1 Tax=Allacma fusca TaxID=39272 RepID=A0A8J2PSK5_9HEXA|nr:unnamed protein product [Allacma fusca]